MGGDMRFHSFKYLMMLHLVALQSCRWGSENTTKLKGGFAPIKTPYLVQCTGLESKNGIDLSRRTVIHSMGPVRGGQQRKFKQTVFRSQSETKPRTLKVEEIRDGSVNYGQILPYQYEKETTNASCSRIQEVSDAAAITAGATLLVPMELAAGHKSISTLAQGDQYMRFHVRSMERPGDQKSKKTATISGYFDDASIIIRDDKEPPLNEILLRQILVESPVYSEGAMDLLGYSPEKLYGWVENVKKTDQHYIIGKRLREIFKLEIINQGEKAAKCD